MTDHTTGRTVQARWDGALRAVVQAGQFELVADEPAAAGGTDTGPQPTDLLLSSIASCFALAMAYSAGKRGVHLADLDVEVTGHYSGPRFSGIRIGVRAGHPRGAELENLVEAAERVCYVTNTLRQPPTIDVVSDT